MASPMNDPAAALAGMARIGNPRQPMGNEAYSVMDGASYTASPNTTLVQKQGAQAGDPTPPTAVRGYGPYALPAGAGDKDGAAYRTQVAFAPMTLPMAGQTQANGRILKGAINRNVPNFGDAYGDAYSL